MLGRCSRMGVLRCGFACSAAHFPHLQPRWQCPCTAFCICRSPDTPVSRCQTSDRDTRLTLCGARSVTTTGTEWSPAERLYLGPRWQQRNKPVCRCAVCPALDHRSTLTYNQEYRLPGKNQTQSLDYLGSPCKWLGLALRVQILKRCDQLHQYARDQKEETKAPCSLSLVGGVPPAGIEDSVIEQREWDEGIGKERYEECRGLGGRRCAGRERRSHRRSERNDCLRP